MPSEELTFNCSFNRFKIIYDPDLALAMYRELASHIEQIENVTTELVWQESTKFSYLGSQIGGMWLTCNQKMSAQSQILIKNILNHYGAWIAESPE